MMTAWSFCAAALAAILATATPVTHPAAPPPRAESVLTWSQARRDADFRRMDELFPHRVVKRGAKVYPLPAGRPLLQVTYDVHGKPQSVASFMADQHMAGVIVLQDGRVRLERYALGFGPKGRWTSFSVAKSMTSTLVGAAIRDGYIHGVDDPVVLYLPEMKGSAYDGVSLRQLLTMTSGVRWNEDYTDPKSDVAQIYAVKPDPGLDATVSYMRKLPRDAEPGTKWVYKTGETNLVGVLVARATGRTLADYLSEKVWRPYGMEQDAAWMVDDRGQESGGCCLSVAMRDYARMGQFILEGGRAGGGPVLPAGWLAAATRKQADIGDPGQGYGYQWWTRDDGSFRAAGIFGQAIFIDPSRRLVVAMVGDWPQATGAAQSEARNALLKAIQVAIDAGIPPAPPLR